MMRIGIDLGGTKIEGVALDDQGAERWRARIATPKDDYPGTVRAIIDLVTRIERETGSRGHIGLATPGAPSRVSGRMKNCNSTWLNGQPFEADLEKALSRPVRIANDADCFTLSEASDGAAKDAAVVFGVIIGTGTGGGVVTDRRLLGGPNSITGEWGHNPLPWPELEELPGPPCYCGLMGCIETWLSGPGLAADHARHGGETIGAEEIAAAAAREEAGAADSLERYAGRLARSLASVINLLDPDVIVLGGGLSRIDFLYRRVPDLWHRWVFSDRVDTRLLAPKHGDASGVRGAAQLWPMSG
jgi:predicted NBD/HSP70 family sugar kinase